MNPPTKSISTKPLALSKDDCIRNDAREQSSTQLKQESPQKLEERESLIASLTSAAVSPSAISPSANVVAEFKVEETQLYLVELSLFQEHQPLNNIKSIGTVSIIKQFDVESKQYALVRSDAQVSLQQISPSSSRAKCLSPREQEIVCLIAFGLSNKQIASHLDISIWTVSTHLRRIFHKLQVDTRAAVVYQCADLIRRLAPVYTESP